MIRNLSSEPKNPRERTVVTCNTTSTQPADKKKRKRMRETVVPFRFIQPHSSNLSPSKSTFSVSRRSTVYTPCVFVCVCIHNVCPEHFSSFFLYCGNLFSVCSYRRVLLSVVVAHQRRQSHTRQVTVITTTSIDKWIKEQDGVMETLERREAG